MSAGKAEIKQDLSSVGFTFQITIVTRPESITLSYLKANSSSVLFNCASD